MARYLAIRILLVSVASLLFYTFGFCQKEGTTSEVYDYDEVSLSFGPELGADPEGVVRMDGEEMGFSNTDPAYRERFVEAVPAKLLYEGAAYTKLFVSYANIGPRAIRIKADNNENWFSSLRVHVKKDGKLLDPSEYLARLEKIELRKRTYYQDGKPLEESELRFVYNQDNGRGSYKPINKFDHWKDTSEEILDKEALRNLTFLKPQQWIVAKFEITNSHRKEMPKGFYEIRVSYDASKYGLKLRSVPTFKTIPYYFKVREVVNDRDRVYYHILRARYFESLNNLSGAAQELIQATRKVPDSMLAWDQLGSFYYHSKGDPLSALACYKRLKELGKDETLKKAQYEKGYEWTPENIERMIENIQSCIANPRAPKYFLCPENIAK